MQSLLETIRHWVLQNWMLPAIFAAFVVYGYFRSARRKRNWKDAAQANNLQFLGKSLPDDLSLNGTSISGVGFKVSNAMTGVLRGIHLIVFDLSDRRGEDRVDQTIVAFQINAELQVPEPPKDPSGSYRFEQAGGRLLAWLPARQIEPDELQDWCTELYDMAARLISEMRTNSNESGNLANRLFREF